MIRLHQRVVSSYQTECRVVFHYINVSCHHIKHCCVVVHYIKVSCPHIKQSVVSSFITSTVWYDDTTRWCNERPHDTLFDVRTGYFDIMSDDTTLFDVMTRHVDVLNNETTLCLIVHQRVVSSHQTVLCRRSLYQSILSSHQTECRIVVHYIKVSCHHIKQSVVSSHTILWCNERRHNILFDVLTGYFDVMNDDTTFCLMWWHDTLM
jgi:hypothetical protein